MMSTLEENEKPKQRLRRGAAKRIANIFSDDDEEDNKPAKTRRKKVTDSDEEFAPISKNNTRSLKRTIKKEKEDEIDKKPRKRRKIKDTETDVSNVENIKQEKSSNTLVNIKKEKIEDSNQQVNMKLENEHAFDTKIKCEPSSSSSLISNLKNESKSLWIDYQLLSETQNIELHYARQLVKLFEEGNTIPFIARYRRDATGNMAPEELRDLKDAYEKIMQLKEKQQTVVKQLEKSSKLTPDLMRSILCTRTFDELDHLYAPFKPGAKRSLAERAKALGLEEPSLAILYNNEAVDLNSIINPESKELQSVEVISKGIVHILAQILATDTELLNELRKKRSMTYCLIETKKAIKRENKTKKESPKNSKPVDELKFENYFDFKQNTRNIRPYQVLAINRGESLKVLSVKIIVPDEIEKVFKRYCYQKWLNNTGKCGKDLRDSLIKEAVEDAYSRLVQPLIIREVRNELKTKAEKAACDVFSNNVKQLLLSAPLKGCSILAIDPGYSNGCKIALISPTGNVICHNVIYPHNSRNPFKDEMILKNMILDNQCETIVLGNGTACRETEAWLTKLISKNIFIPLNVKYTIVSENGASIYSCSPEAKKEFPKLDPNIISAISLARRIQDPLAELVKIEPKHLGVGMYQHDIPKKQLEEALDEVVSECVSFTGVDLNTASQCLLRRIAGLTDKRATAIIDHREKNGPFICRKDLLDVKGIGPKVFEQCAGFLRVGPFNRDEETIFYRHPKANRLDRTDIHPESYNLASEIITRYNLNINNIGQHSFTNTITRWKTMDITRICKELDKPEQTISLIFDALSKPLNYDFRNEISKTPLFKEGLTRIEDLKVNSVLTGCIRNVCDFGCFVDIGVGQDGLIHNSKMNGLHLQLGDNVEVNVINLDIARKRIGLAAVKKL